MADILEPPKKNRSKVAWIIIAVIVALLLILNFVPLYKWF
jgi:hypothetical protein